MSVYKINDLAETEIWQIGDQYVAAIKGTQLVGRGDISETILGPLGLKAVSNADPHPRHMNVVGWPIEKDKRISIALELSQTAVYVPKPSSFLEVQA